MPSQQYQFLNEPMISCNLVRALNTNQQNCVNSLCLVQNPIYCWLDKVLNSYLTFYFIRGWGFGCELTSKCCYILISYPHLHRELTNCHGEQTGTTICCRIHSRKTPHTHPVSLVPRPLIGETNGLGTRLTPCKFGFCSLVPRPSIT